jgi:carbon storage regulator
MLILSRKPGESIVIDGRITVKIVRLDGDTIKLGISAPLDIPVHRQEVYEEIQRNNVEALTNKESPLPRLAAAKAPAAPGLSLKPAKPKITPANRRSAL